MGPKLSTIQAGNQSGNWIVTGLSLIGAMEPFRDGRIVSITGYSPMHLAYLRTVTRCC